jgi:hypothetical protein
MYGGPQRRIEKSTEHEYHNEFLLMVPPMSCLYTHFELTL